MTASRETRSQTLIRHLELHQHRTGNSWPIITQRIVEEYHRLVPLPRRVIEFHDPESADDPYAAMRANAQLMRRIREGIVRFPADLEEAVVAALPEPLRQTLLDDLADHYGLLAVKMPTYAPVEDVHYLADFWKEAGEAAEAVLAMIRDDGRIGPEDMDKAEFTLCQLEDVMAVAGGIKAKIIQIREGRA